jgi:hypothetical protein
MTANLLMLVAGLGLVSARAARADQCQVLEDRDVAERAARLLAQPRTTIATLCEPCGELAPGSPELVRSPTVRRQAGGWVVAVGGQDLDLAYTYVQTSPSQFANLAALAGCPAHGVSLSLQVDGATATGVLIRADSSIAPATPPVSADQRSEPLVVAPRSETPTFWWWGDALMFLFGGAISATLLGAMSQPRSRQLPHQPRAEALIGMARERHEDEA